jgi:ectoine hydroxylase-related dioxygenase (phytanoyl-CoA dioxygenase family)
METEIKTFGVKEFHQVSSDEDKVVEQIRLMGYSILPDILGAKELKIAQDKMQQVYERQTQEIGGQQNLAAINDTFTAMCLLGYDDFFLELATHPRLLAIVRRFLGEYFILMLQNGIMNVPEVGVEQTAGRWHRDLGYQHFTTTRPISLTALYCIDDFTDETGGTHVLPASHKSEAFPSEEFVRQHERIISAKAGSVIIFDSMIYHRGGRNRSSHVRRGINNIYTLPLIRQQIDLPKMLNGRFRDDPFLGKFLGYECQSDPTVIEFRQRRLRRIKTD